MAGEKHLRILVVEDDFLIAMDLERLLTDFGYDVCGLASNARQAVRLALRLRPDLVMTDVELAHGSNGLDVARDVYTQLHIPSFILSAQVDRTRFDDLPRPPLGTMAKPFEPGGLRRALVKAEAACAAFS